MADEHRCVAAARRPLSTQALPEVSIRSYPLVRATVFGSLLALSSMACARPATDPSLKRPTTASGATDVSCDTVALHASGVVRSRVLVLQLAPADSAHRLPQPASDSILARAAAALRLPRALTLPVYSSLGRLPDDTLERGDSNWVHLSVDAMVRVPLAPDAPATPTLLMRSYDAALDSALLQAAIRAVESEASMPALVTRGRPSPDDTTRALHLSLRLSPADSSTRARSRRRIVAGRLLERALGEVQIPHYGHAKVPEAVRSSQFPRYPRHLLESGVEGEVLLQGVVGPDGRLMLQSLRVLRASHPSFAAAVVAAAPNFRYVPARVAGCPVPMRVQQSFGFAFAR